MSHPRVTLLRAAAVAGLLVATLVVYSTVLLKMARDWWSITDYSHGLICAPLAVGLVWLRRDELKRTPLRPDSTALLGVFFAVALLLLGTLGAELFLTRISFLVFIASTVAFVAGWRHLRIVAFPLVLLLVSVPIPAILITRITLPLQFVASGMAERSLTAIGIPVLREGNVLVLPNATLQVAEACSGIRSLVSLLTMALVIARFSDHRALARVAIVFAAVPVAILVNGLRVAITSAATYSFGPSVAEGLIHEMLGWLMFLLALILLTGWAHSVAKFRHGWHLGTAR